ncbi:hypothetical protein TRFO_02407 [Tritrichomonas foetus]|uniref:Leucine Rich Repeat family protein n=1 Tax=Tritrichomonas foetus TaxID=1144522 RepID=A0A1J4J8Y6_9EUKA|nr:hypothetical protein TRFO_02407 [Tritrichomonas foetus]|eukprot:OHS93869.1 hypothetical protein TRFO_02407 [Tritrichomonas foetus]
MTTQGRTNLIHFPKQQLEKFNEFLWGATETIFVAQEVTKLHLNGGNAPRTIVVTSGAFYVFRPKNFNRIECGNIYSIISLTKVVYVEPDILNLTYGENTFVFKSSDALSIGQLLVNQHAMVAYQVPSYEPLRIESTPPSALKPSPELNFRPASLFQTRLIIWAHYYNTQFPLQNVRTFRDWDHKHSGPFKIDSTFEHNGAIAALAHTISWDADLKHLIIDSFAPDQLGPFLSTIFAQSFALSRISIENIASPLNTDFDLSAREDTAISSISFKGTHPHVVISFFNALEKFNGRIRVFQLSNCNIHNEELADIFQSIATLPCFMKLQYLSLDQLNINEFPLNEFSAMLSKLRVLSTVVINQLDLEGSDVLNLLLKQAQLPRHIEVTGLKFTVPVVAELPESVTHINISNSEFTVETFATLMKSILAKNRSSPLFLTASNIKGASTKQFLGQLENIELLPLIYELNWSGNRLLPKDMKALLSFLKTQTNLKFLDIEKCIFHEDQPEKSLQSLSEFLRETPIEGLGMLCDSSSPISIELLPFITSLSGCPGIKSFRLLNSQLKDAGIEPIIKMVQECPDICEIDIDGMEVSSTIDLIRLYNGLLMNPKIVSLSTPKKELALLGITKENMQPEVKKMLLALKTKKIPKNSMQRLALCEHLQVEIDDDEQGSELDFESMLTLIEPASLLSKPTAGPGKSKMNPLEELNAVMRAMVAVMRDEPSERQVEPVPMARMIMDHLVTSKKALKVAHGSSKHSI